MENQTPSDNQQEDSNHRLYEHALVLIEHQFQIFWLVFGAFLLTETVILSGIGSLVKDLPKFAFMASLLGLCIIVPWWTSYRYNQKMYHLRVRQAKNFEPTAGMFYTEGERFIQGEEVHGIKMPCDARLLPPRRADALLIVLFAFAFLFLAVYLGLKLAGAFGHSTE